MNFMAFPKKGHSEYEINPNFIKLYHYLIICVKFALFLKHSDCIDKTTKHGYINKKLLCTK